MSSKRTTIELDENLTAEALAASGETLRSTVEQGLRLVVAQSRQEEERRQASFEQHLASAAKAVDFDVLMSGEAWR